MSHSRSRRNASDSETDEDNELLEVGESQKTIPLPILRVPQIHVARVACSRATVQNRLRAGGG